MGRRTAAFSIMLAIFLIGVTLSPGGAPPIAHAQAAPGQSAISGIVYDANHKPIGGAKVTLYYTQFLVNDYKAAGLVKTPYNPQYTGNASQSPGYYEFTGIPPDVYILTAEKDGIVYSETIQVKDESKTADLTIPGYVAKPASSKPPAPTDRFGPTYTITVAPAPDGSQDLDLGALILDVLKILLMTVIVLQFLTGIIVIARRIGQQK